MSGYVSDAVIRRLPAYYRHLRELEEDGVMQISSQDLGSRMQLTPSQIRQDINSIGGLGRQGYGYPVRELKEHIRDIMGLNAEHRMVIFGAGRMGRAVADYSGFRREGFVTVAMFDTDPEKIGSDQADVHVYGMAEVEELLPGMNASMAVLAVPAAAAQEVLDRLYALGIRAFWNFAPVDLVYPRDAVVVNVHLSDSLYTLGYMIKHTGGW